MKYKLVPMNDDGTEVELDENYEVPYAVECEFCGVLLVTSPFPGTSHAHNLVDE